MNRCRLPNLNLPSTPRGKLAVVTSSDPLPVPDGAPDRLRIAACQRVLDWVRANAAAWTAGADIDEIDLLVLSFFARSSRTFRGVLIVSERGFGEPASMLSRSLFEDMVDAHWAHGNPSRAVERIHQHDKFSRLLRIESRKDHRWVFKDAETPPPVEYTDEELAEWKELFGSKGTKSWTGVSRLDMRVHAIARQWPKDGRRQLRFMHGYANKIQNEILHPSGLSIARVGLPSLLDDGSPEWNMGSTRTLLPMALFASLWTFTHTVGLIHERYCPKATEELDELFGQADRDFRQANHWETTEALTPLPGSTAQNAPEST